MMIIIMIIALEIGQISSSGIYRHLAYKNMSSNIYHRLTYLQGDYYYYYHHLLEVLGVVLLESLLVVLLVVLLVLVLLLLLLVGLHI